VWRVKTVATQGLIVAQPGEPSAALGGDETGGRQQ
jgi:hypothetical protein